MKGFISGLIIAGLAAGSALAAPKKAKAAKDEVLGAGEYSAKVKAMVCGGCTAFIEDALQEVKGVETAKADIESSRVNFTVKADAKVKRSELQKSLDKWAKKMGMGADFSLSELKPAKKGT